MFVFCMYVRLLFDIDTFADDGDSGLMKYSNLVVNTLQYFLINVEGMQFCFFHKYILKISFNLIDI